MYCTFFGNHHCFSKTAEKQGQGSDNNVITWKGLSYKSDCHDTERTDLLKHRHAQILYVNTRLEGCFWLVRAHTENAKEFPRIWEFLTDHFKLLVDSIN